MTIRLIVPPDPDVESRQWDAGIQYSNGKSGEHRLDLLSYFHPVTVAVVVLKRAFVSLNWNTFVVSLSLSACFDSNSSIGVRNILWKWRMSVFKSCSSSYTTEVLFKQTIELPGTFECCATTFSVHFDAYKTTTN